MRLPRILPVAIALLFVGASLGAAEGDMDYLRDLDAALAVPEPLPAGNALFHDIRVRVTASRHTVLSSQSTGRVESLAARDGDRFAEGDLLVQLDDSTLQLQKTRARAALGRQQVLYRVTQEMVDLQSRGEAELEVARMEMEQAEAELQVVELLLARTKVAAPFPGRVADVFVKEKQFVPEGAPLVEVLDDSTLELEFIVPSVWMRWFTPGYRFSVVIEETGAGYDAILERLGGKVDPLSQSVKAYASLVDPRGDLMEGMSGAARIAPPEAQP